MASDETMTLHSSSLQDEDFDDDIDDGYDQYHQHPHPHNLSRLSVCTSSTLCGADDDDDDDGGGDYVDVDNAITMYVSRLSIESFEGDDGDADGEFSDGKELPATGLSSEDSENELGGCYSLPATPPRRRNRVGPAIQTPVAVKEYASDNEAQKGVFFTGQKTENNDEDPWRRRRRRRRRRSRRIRSDGSWVFDRASNWESSEKNISKNSKDLIQGFSGGESDQSGGGGGAGSTGVRVITRPKGGRRSLCMDLEEVKACRDLGFELEHERMLEMPPRPSGSNSTTLDTSSGSNSPIANWRISSPGDDPREVKARLKVWAQAVALASTSKYGT